MSQFTAQAFLAPPGAMSARCESDEQYQMCTCAHEKNAGFSQGSTDVIPAERSTLSGMPSTWASADVLAGSMAVDMK